MKDSIRRGQFSILVFFMPLIFKISTLPSYIAGRAGTDSIFLMATVLGLEFIHLIVILRIINAGGVRRLEELYGKKRVFFITLPLLFTCLARLLAYGVKVADYVTYFLFYNVDHFGIKTVLFLAVFYVAIKGLRGIGRLAELGLAFFPLIIFLGVVFGKTDLNLQYVLPLGTISAEEFMGCFSSLLFWVTDFTPFLFVDIAEPTLEMKKKKPFPYVSVACLLCLVALEAIYVVFFSNYGEAAPIIDHVFARLAAFNVVTTQVGSLEWPTIVMWLIFSLLYLSLNAYAGGRAVSELIPNFRISVGIIAVAAIILSQTVVKETAGSMELALSSFRYVAIGVDVGVSIIMLLLLTLSKKHRHTEIVNETQL